MTRTLENSLSSKWWDSSPNVVWKYGLSSSCRSRCFKLLCSPRQCAFLSWGINESILWTLDSTRWQSVHSLRGPGGNHSTTKLDQLCWWPLHNWKNVHYCSFQSGWLTLCIGENYNRNRKIRYESLFLLGDIKLFLSMKLKLTWTVICH